MTVLGGGAALPAGRAQGAPIYGYLGIMGCLNAAQAIMAAMLEITNAPAISRG